MCLLGCHGKPLHETPPIFTESCVSPLFLTRPFSISSRFKISAPQRPVLLELSGRSVCLAEERRDGPQKADAEGEADGQSLHLIRQEGGICIDEVATTVYNLRKETPIYNHYSVVDDFSLRRIQFRCHFQGTSIELGTRSALIWRLCCLRLWVTLVPVQAHVDFSCSSMSICSNSDRAPNSIRFRFVIMLILLLNLRGANS